MKGNEEQATPPNCYKCKYRRDLAGDAHSRCVHPSLGQMNATDQLEAMFASVGRAAPVISEKARELNVKGHPIGARRGWFNWPHNFDPTWLQSCDGFESKSAGEASKGVGA